MCVCVRIDICSNLGPLDKVLKIHKIRKEIRSLPLENDIHIFIINSLNICICMLIFHKL